MMIEPTVWVIQDNNYNIRTAEEYGTLRFITQHDLNMVSGSRSELLVTNDIREFIKEFNNNTDHILVIGNPIVIGLVFAALGQNLVANDSVIKILKWDARDKVYYDLEIDLDLL